MDPDERLRVLMELEGVGSPHISGRLALDGDVREFSGWLSLMALLEGLRTDMGRSRAPPFEEGDSLEAAGAIGPLASQPPPQDRQDDTHINTREG